MPQDPRIFDSSGDMYAAALYAKQVVSDDLFFPVLVDAAGNLCVNMTVGSVSLSSTASVITNSPSNPVNVSLTNTAVTVAGTVSLASTVVTVQNSSPGFNVNIATATLGTVITSLSSTVVTVQNSAPGFNVNIATATLGTVTTSLSNTIVTVHTSPSASVVTVHFSNTASIVTVSPRAGAIFTTSFNSTLVTVAPQAGTTTTASTITNAATNPANVTLVKSSVSTVTSISASATSSTLLASNTNRKFATFYNNSAVNLYVAFNATVTSLSFTVKIPPYGYYEIPLSIYTGAISGIWDSANGNAQITEY